jgi:hypothetical protein
MLLLLGFSHLLGLKPVRANDQSNVFTIQAPSVVSGAGNIIGITLPVVNGSQQALSSVMVSSVRLQLESDDDDYANLIVPTLPINVANVPAGGQFLFAATFNGEGLRVGTSHLLTIHGTYMMGGSTIRFAVQQAIAIPGRTSFFLGVNKTDQLLLEGRAANGYIFDYFGPKDANGFATGLSSVTIQTGEGLFRFNLDSKGRPQQIFAADGTSFTMNWSSDTLAIVTAISADGAQHKVFPLDLAKLQSGQLAVIPNSNPVGTALAPSMPTLSASGSYTPALDVAALPKAQFVPPNESKPTPLPSCKLTSSLASPMIAPVGIDPSALIQVNRCGPVVNADVRLQYIPPFPFSGSLGPRYLPAILTDATTGTYSAEMPSLGAEVASFQSACQATSQFLGTVGCQLARVSPFLCLSLPFVDLAGLIPACQRVATLAIAACQTLGGNGVSNIFNGFCSVVTAGLNLAAQGNIEMRPFVFIPGAGTGFGTLTQANSSGPFPGEPGGGPPMTVSFQGGGSPVIDSISRIIYGYPKIDSLPFNEFPRGGSYTAVVSGSCLSGATGLQATSPAVTVSLLSVSDKDLTVQISSTTVPDGQTQLAPIPGVGFTVLLGNQPLGSPSTFDIVAGLPPEVTSFQITNGVTAIPAGVPTSVDFQVNILDSGNIQFFYLGCGNCATQFGPIVGSQFDSVWNFSELVTIPSGVTGAFGIIAGAVDGAGQGGVTGNDPASPVFLQIPIF